MRQILASTDFRSGMLFILLGGGFFYISLGYAYGSPSEMGPGFFPRFLSGGVIAIGLILIAKSILRRATIEPGARIHLKPALFVLSSLAAFALLLRPVGLIAATIAVVVISGIVAPNRRWREVAIGAVVLAAFAAIVFVKLLGVSMPLWPRGLF